MMKQQKDPKEPTIRGEYDPSRNALKECVFCGEPLKFHKGSVEIGKCSYHSNIWREDIKAGLHKQNRLKQLIDSYHQ